MLRLNYTVLEYKRSIIHLQSKDPEKVMDMYVFQHKQVMTLNRIEHEYLLYCPYPVINGFFLIFNPLKYHRRLKRDGTV